jgi:DNA polymerase V
MENAQRTYLCIDLKTFYASVECAERGLDPFTTNLVVADPTRGRTTICLAISPAMKALGVRNRCRIFEIPEGIEYIKAMPRMKLYMRKSAEIYQLYLRYFSQDDIHVYSVDECFIDVTPYLSTYGNAVEIAHMLIDAVFEQTHITATAGVGTNLFLAKVALDVTAKHTPSGIGVLDEQLFKQQIQPHRPITDIWGIGPGIARRLARRGIYDLAGVAATSRDALFKEFGVNAEFLIDHANGVEPCTIAQIKKYQSKSTGMGNGQVLPRDYAYEETLTVLREMCDTLVHDLMAKHCVAGGVALMVGYGRAGGQNSNEAGVAWSNTASENAEGSHGDGIAHSSGGSCGFEGSFRVSAERAFANSTPTKKKPSPWCLPTPTKGGPGQPLPHTWRELRGGYAGGQRKMAGRTASLQRIWQTLLSLYQDIVDPSQQIRRLNINLTGVMSDAFEEYSLFDMEERAEERTREEAIMAVKKKFGANALLRASSLTEASTIKERNNQVGGHHA